MPVLDSDFHESVRPTQQETHQAQESCQRLLSLLEQRNDIAIRIGKKGKSLEEIILPAPVLQILTDALGEMAKGHRVQIIPVQEELSTQEAADFLKVSRPYLVRLLDEKKIPSRKVGRHRRVLFEDVLRYKEQDTEERLRILAELTEQAQQLNMGY